MLVRQCMRTKAGAYVYAYKEHVQSVAQSLTYLTKSNQLYMVVQVYTLQ